MDGYQELNQRNFRAMSEGLKSVRTENENLKEKVKKMDEKLGELNNLILALQQQNGILLARFHGTGATT